MDITETSGKKTDWPCRGVVSAKDLEPMAHRPIEPRRGAGTAAD